MQVLKELFLYSPVLGISWSSYEF